VFVHAYIQNSWIAKYTHNTHAHTTRKCAHCARTHTQTHTDTTQTQHTHTQHTNNTHTHTYRKGALGQEEIFIHIHTYIQRARERTQHTHTHTHTHTRIQTMDDAKKEQWVRRRFNFEKIPKALLEGSEKDARGGWGGV